MKHFIIAIVAITAIGCDAGLTRAHKAEVWFKGAPQVAAGAVVMVGEHEIGKTGEPVVISGNLRVPLLLTSATAVPDATIFVIKQDPRGTRLVAHPAGNPLHLPNGKPFQFRGAATQAECWWMLAKDKLEDLSR